MKKLEFRFEASESFLFESSIPNKQREARMGSDVIVKVSKAFNLVARKQMTWKIREEF